MIESLLSSLQSIVGSLWGGVVNTISMPWRGSLAVVIAAYLLRPIIRIGAPWLLIGLLSLARGVCWVMPRLLLFIEGVVSILLEKAGIKSTSVQEFFSDTAVKSFAALDTWSQSLINKIKSPGEKRRMLRLRWVMLAAALIPLIYFSTLHTRKDLDVVPTSFAWWHSFEHFLLSGAFLPQSGQKHVKHTLKVNDSCSVEVSCLLNEALKAKKLSTAELRLDNPNRFPSFASSILLKNLPGNWINYGNQSNLVRELLPAPTPTPIPVATPEPVSTMTDNTQSPEPSLPKPAVQSVSILIPVRSKTSSAAPRRK